MSSHDIIDDQIENPSVSITIQSCSSSQSSIKQFLNNFNTHSSQSINSLNSSNSNLGHEKANKLSKSNNIFKNEMSNNAAATQNTHLNSISNLSINMVTSDEELEEEIEAKISSLSHDINSNSTTHNKNEVMGKNLLHHLNNSGLNSLSKIENLTDVFENNYLVNNNNNNNINNQENCIETRSTSRTVANYESDEDNTNSYRNSSSTSISSLNNANSNNCNSNINNNTNNNGTLVSSSHIKPPEQSSPILKSNSIGNSNSTSNSNNINNNNSNSNNNGQLSNLTFETERSKSNYSSNSHSAYKMNEFEVKMLDEQKVEPKISNLQLNDVRKFNLFY